ncbi:MAG: OsmC family protein [Bacillota bacterium]|nr:OsmC family protein [Bacillota bacterium]
MNNGQLEVSLNLINQKVQFTCVSETNPDRPLTLDYLPPLGDGQGYRGLELLLMSFAGCVSTAVVGLLRKIGKDISGYTMKVIGTKNDQPLFLKKISFEITVKSSDITDEDMEKVLSYTGKISPVWLALNKDVEVVPQYKIVS